MASSHVYPSQWDMPYRLERQANGLLHTARLWWWLTGLGALLAAVFSGAFASGVFTLGEWALFTALGALFGLGAAARARWLCVQAKRLLQVQALCREMDDAPRSWREFALARQAYEYAHQDDTVQLWLALPAFALGATVLAGNGLALLLNRPPAVAIWTATGLWLLGAGIWLARVGMRYRSRRALMLDLGPRPERQAWDHRRAA